MYSEFAYVYDELTKDIDYLKLADYLEELMLEYAKMKPKLVLDLACGTGSLTVQFAKRGYDMIGIDISADMLNCALERSTELEKSPLWVCQDMRSFELYGTVDAILCATDSLNYITDYNDLKSVFRLVKNYLNPGGIFIFDMNTPYKIEKILGNNVFYEVHDDIAYIWQNSYNTDTRIATFDLTFFIKQSEQLYKKIEEEQCQKAWSLDEIKSALDESGLRLLNTYESLTKDPPSDTTQRYVYISALAE